MGVSVRVGPKYQVVIPNEIRQKIGLHPKDEVMVEEVKGTAVIIPKPESFTGLMVGLGKEVWKGVDVRDFIKKERDSWEKKAC